MSAVDALSVIDYSLRIIFQSLPDRHTTRVINNLLDIADCARLCLSEGNHRRIHDHILFKSKVYQLYLSVRLIIPIPIVIIATTCDILVFILWEYSIEGRIYQQLKQRTTPVAKQLAQLPHTA